MGDTRHQRAQLRQPVRLNQLALQQRFLRYVDGEEQQHRRRARGIDVGDHRLHFPHRLLRHLDGQIDSLQRSHRVPQRPDQRRPLRGGDPFGQGTTLQQGVLRGAEQPCRLGIGLEYLAIDRQHQRG